MRESRNEIGLEEARGKLGDIVDRVHNEGDVTYLTRYGKKVAAIVPMGCRAAAAPPSAINAAMKAAWPGLPEGMTMDEARRRTIAALNAAYPHLVKFVLEEDDE